MFSLLDIIYTFMIFDSIGDLLSDYLRLALDSTLVIFVETVREIIYIYNVLLLRQLNYCSSFKKT
jgi:hypothetical protein